MTAPDDDEFEARVLRCIMVGLSELGDGAGDSLLQYLRLTRGMAPQEVVTRPEEFDSAVKEVFNESAPYVQRLIAGAMAAEFGIRGPVRSFSDALKTAQGR